MYVLHTEPDTASLILRLALEEIGVPYRTHPIDRDRGRLTSPEYLALAPTGLIPVLETPDGPVFETAAILLWLGDRHREAALCPASNDPGRAAFLSWLFFVSNSLHADLRMLFYPERYAGRDSDVTGFARVTELRVARHLRLLETLATEAHAWFHPDRPGLLTIYVPTLLRWMRLYPVCGSQWFDLAPYPGLAAIGQSAEARPAARRVARDENLGPTIFTLPSMPGAARV